MIFTLESSSNRITATLPGTNSENTYFCTLSICSSPTCCCENVQIDFLPASIKDGALSPAVPFTVEIDLTKWRTNGQEYLLTGSKTNSNVLKNMDEADYELLMSQFLSKKLHCLNEVDFDTLVADFPKEDFEKGSPLISYTRIIPHANPFCVELNGQEYLVDDQYCVKPDCSCAEAHLTFLH